MDIEIKYQDTVEGHISEGDKVTVRGFDIDIDGLYEIESVVDSKGIYKIKLTHITK